MRPRQWTKNLLVFGALLFVPGALFDPTALGRAVLAFVVFSLAASAGYLVNDIKDRDYDRTQPRKADRPVAAGRLSIGGAVGAAIVLVAIVLGGGVYLDLSPFELPPPATPLDGVPFGFLLTILAYFVLSGFYTAWLKQVPLLDVIILSAGFTLRAVAGAVALRVIISPWLLLCTGLLALFLGLGKRRQELVRLQVDLGEQGAGASSGRASLEGYTVPLVDQLLIIAASVNVMSYSLYTFSASGHPDNRLMLTIPFVIYGIFRYHFLIHNAEVGEAPEEVLLADRPLQVCLILWVVSVAILFFLPGFSEVG